LRATLPRHIHAVKLVPLSARDREDLVAYLESLR
jgi:hypothetical protein